MKKIKLQIKEELYDELAAIAKKRNIEPIDLIRRWIKLGLIADDIQDDPNACIVIREGERERILDMS